MARLARKLPVGFGGRRAALIVRMIRAIRGEVSYRLPRRRKAGRESRQGSYLGVMVQSGSGSVPGPEPASSVRVIGDGLAQPMCGRFRRSATTSDGPAFVFAQRDIGGRDVTYRAAPFGRVTSVLLTGLTLPFMPWRKEGASSSVASVSRRRSDGVRKAERACQVGWLPRRCER